MARRPFFMGFPGFRLPPPLPTATATPPLQSLPCLQLLTEFSQKTPGQAPPAQIPAALAIANEVFEKQTDCTQTLSRTPRVLYLFQFCLRKTQSALSGFLAKMCHTILSYCASTCAIIARTWGLSLVDWNFMAGCFFA